MGILMQDIRKIKHFKTLVIELLETKIEKKYPNKTL